MKVFLDTEFTALKQQAALISLALVAQDGREFYAEISDYKSSEVSDWSREHVIPKLYINAPIATTQNNALTLIYGDRSLVRDALQTWIQSFNQIEIWADVLAYDWVLFCELFGGALHIPENIFYAPFDLATLFKIKGFIEPRNHYERDVKRYEFAGADESKQHHALEDARVEKTCFNKLISL